ncbi:MAG: DUF3572 family protein [Pseudomonadota bacterium]
MMKSATDMNEDQAREIGLAALVFVTASPDRLETFMAQAGIDATTLMQSAAAPATQTACLNHLAASDETLLAFVAEQGLTPDHVKMALHLLQGGGGDDWV